jgi:hypothetical protein
MPKKKYQNPKGGLNQAGRDYYKRTEGANLKAPVKSSPDTPAEMRRKGSFLVRMGSAQGALKDDKGEPTRLKKSLVAWGHNGDKASAVAKGRRLLERYKKRKEQA